MSWIEPLELQKWLVNVFAGDSTYFAALAILSISAMAAYFRMTTLGMFLMVGIFLLMFSGFISPSIVIFAAIIGGLVVGYVISLIIKR